MVARITASSAMAHRAMVTWRCQPVALRTSYSSSPTSTLSVSKPLSMHPRLARGLPQGQTLPVMHPGPLGTQATGPRLPALCGQAGHEVLHQAVPDSHMLIAGHGQHVGLPLALQPLPQLGGVAIDAVPHHPGRRHSGRRARCSIRRARCGLVAKGVSPARPTACRRAGASVQLRGR